MDDHIERYASSGPTRFWERGITGPSFRVETDAPGGGRLVAPRQSSVSANDWIGCG